MEREDIDDYESVNCPKCGSGNITREFEYGYDRGMTKGVDVKVKCQRCGMAIQSFEDSTHQMRSPKDFQSHGKSGSGGLYYGPNWDDIRRRVKARDGWECKGCGKEDVKHHVHHITPFREFIDGDDVNYDDANDFSNLVTLCPTCHGKAEGEYMDYTRDEFVNNVGIGKIEK